MRISLRQQIFLWYALLLPAIVIGLAFTAQKVMVEGLRATLDQHLQERTEIVASSIISNPELNLAAYDELIEWLTEQQLPYVPTILRVSDPQRNVIATFGDVPDPLVPIMDRQLLLPELTEGRFETIKTKGHEALRLYTMPVYNPATDKVIVLVQTGDSLATVVEAQNELWQYTLIIGIGGSLLIILVGFFILRRGFRPLDRILSRVKGIGSRNLTVRIPGESRPPELQHLVDTLNNMLERLETAFRTRENFIAGVSHDLRTPLTVIQGQIDILLMQSSKDENTRQSLERIAREVRRLSRMTSNLLYSIQLESNPILPSGEVDLHELLGEIYREAQILAEGVNLNVSLQDNVYILGDYDLLKQMVLNVVDNAFKFTPQKGTVNLILRSDNNSAIIEVADNGKGISEEHLSHITKPFYKADISRKPGRGGAGLGLSIVKKVVDLHHGKLKIQSQEGLGTTVTTWFPLQPGNADDN